MSALSAQELQLAFPVAVQVFGAAVAATAGGGKGRLTAYQAEKIAEKSIVAALAFGRKWAELLKSGGRPPWAVAGAR